jgi:hypothetical protein
LKVPLSPIQDEESDDKQDPEFAPVGDGSIDDNVVIVGGDENKGTEREMCLWAISKYFVD